MNKKNFSEMMAFHRKKKGLSMRELAEQTGIKLERMTAYESGDFEPKADEIKRIANALDVPLVVLMHGKHISVHVSKTDENGLRVCEWKEY